MAGPSGFDVAKRDRFLGKVIGDLSGTFVTAMSVIGDRLGLFNALSSSGPVTAEEFAELAGIDRRYSEEWLAAMSHGGYLEYNSDVQQFWLPPEHVPALAEESGPYFVGGIHQQIPGLVGKLEPVMDAFRNGGGVSQSEYGSDHWEGLERLTASWYENLLIQEWIPSAAGVYSKLEQGADFADVGCGSGWALIKLAQAFPRSRFVGYDVYQPSIERARANAVSVGVGDRVTFKTFDVAPGIPERFDVISTFDVIHDLVDPVGTMRSIRRALKPGGSYLLLEMNCSDSLEENHGPIGAMMMGVSVLYCMTVSLADQGAGLGAYGMPPAKVEELGTEAGFSTIERLVDDNPFSALYELRS
ncbi:MAG: methyltransferase domain-containing protein [Chloroflexi bacterium]|nr:methyltransferase domain-containing protein [Chloroflexota bacterium]MBT4073596.1 methyltransferase domain-containing protein [Chloroflexota bacterium]MBT4515148.1 methyltransferase domain-containing protein [Chloroflexota bacterium]MBT5319027.1 methyltransferase domain-containing protein [Chloroflexota bacterium]